MLVGWLVGWGLYGAEVFLALSRMRSSIGVPEAIFAETEKRRRGKWTGRVRRSIWRVGYREEEVEEEEVEIEVRIIAMARIGCFLFPRNFVIGLSHDFFRSFSPLRVYETKHDAGSRKRFFSCRLWLRGSCARA